MTRKGQRKGESKKESMPSFLREARKKNQRNNFLHKLSHYHIDKYNVIVLKKIGYQKKGMGLLIPIQKGH
ncbi:hypothetical protein DPC56_06560 [Methanothermobacter tenebrarum]|uniref:Uncharacterized protein n=1 Tax=Methanothermobacter tenebrarum TaxID=680118 RepID=A0A328PH67_9EURY|nr:hypothetical protein DPC56_06560 [Methanothermobacter tenebrarum]